MELRKTFLGDCDGVAAIEFALIAPILLLVVVAVIDFGMYLNTVMKLENTARAAAEYVAQGGDPADIQTDIVDPSPLTDDQKQSLVVETDFACE